MPQGAASRVRRATSGRVERCDALTLDRGSPTTFIELLWSDRAKASARNCALVFAGDLRTGAVDCGVIRIQKKIVVDENGAPKEAIIPWKQFCEIAEALGFDLDEKAAADLRAAKRDWRQRKTDAFIPLSKL